MSFHNQNRDQYPEAGRNAQPEIKRAVRRYKGLPEAYRRRIPLLYWLLGSGTPPYKMSKAEAAYVDRTQHHFERCSNCIFAFMEVKTGRYICSQMRGEIRPEGWCRLWRT